MEKRLWLVSVQQVDEGYFYVWSRSKQAAQDLAWTCLGRGAEPRGIGHGYIVSATAVDDPATLREILLEELGEEGADADEDNPALIPLERLPEIWDP